MFHNAVISGPPTNGYVVGKAKAGDTIAIWSVVYQKGEKVAYFSDKSFEPCGNAKTMVFKVPHGKVAYLGTIDYKFQDNRLQVRYANELDGAKRYVDSAFPALKGKVEQVEPELRPVNSRCGGTVYIPIYVGR
jgi:hypothetical protein